MNEHTGTPPTRTRLALLLGCFLLSGVAGLIYETAWTQQFSLVFGTSELAVAAVLAAYMAGLAAGAGLAARWARRVRRPLVAYALIELGVAAAALLVPLGLKWASAIQLTVLGSVALAPESASLASALFYLLAAFAVLMLPTTLMGASLPVLVRQTITEDAQIGARVGWLYAVNTGGAAAGTLLAAYLLLPRLGLNGTVLAAVSINVAVFLLALTLARFSGPAKVIDGARTRPLRGARWILPLIFVSGIVSFSYEVLWTRLLSHLLGGTLFAFATMLATFLGGITLGSAAASFYAKDPASARRGFLIAQLGIAVCFLAAFGFADGLTSFAAGLASGGGSFANIALLSAATLLPGALFIGAAFPFAVRLLAGSAADAAPASGRVFAWNTTGAILGAVGSGFFLLPTLHFAGTVLAATATSLLLAVLTALGPKPRLWRWAVPAFAVMLMVYWWPPQQPERVLRTSPLTGKPVVGDLAFSAVGRSATTLLVRQGPRWRLTTNGLPESQIQLAGGRMAPVSIAHWLGLLPLVSQPDAQSMLVIGFGAGRTLEAIAPTVEALHVVELEPEVIHANRLVAARRSDNPFADPRLKIHLNDARSGLQLADQQFDAIVSQPSHPWTAGASHLFTQEFFTLVRQRLNPDGVFVQWIGLPFVDRQTLLSLLASLNEVFDHVELYQPPPGGAVLFLASMGAPTSEPAAARALQNGGTLWHRLGVLNAQDILATRILDADASRQIAANAPANRDNRNLLRLRPPGARIKNLDQQSFRQLVAKYDPLGQWQPENGDLYLLRRLLAARQLLRARQLAENLADQNLMRTAQALIDLRLPAKREAAKQTLAQSLMTDPDSDEAFYALLGAHQAAVIAGDVPAALATRLATDPVARTVVSGWQFSSSRNTAKISTLETALADIPASHPLYSNAIRLRVAWRLASGDPVKAREGIRLYDPILALDANPHELLIRARLAALAQQPEAVISTLYEVAGKINTRRGPRRRALAIESLKLLDNLPPTPGHAALIDDLRARLAFPRLIEASHSGQ